MLMPMGCNGDGDSVTPGARWAESDGPKTTMGAGWEKATDQ